MIKVTKEKKKQNVEGGRKESRREEMCAGKDGPSSFHVASECETQADEADALLSAVSPDMPGIF